MKHFQMYSPAVTRTIRNFFILLALVVLLIQRVDAADRPNVVLISVDDLNDWVGYMGGHPQAKTPNIDRLANKGIAFTRGYSSAPLCNPSRVSLLTGILPSNSGVYGNQENFREYLPNALTLMQYFKKYGYSSYNS